MSFLLKYSNVYSLKGLWILLTLVNLATAKNILQSGSISSCMENSRFYASYFHFSLFPENGTFLFDISSFSDIDGEVIIGASIIAYGLEVINKTFDPCITGSKELCPITPGPIDTMGEFSLNKTLIDKIPKIAFTIPDLDGIARVIVKEKKTNKMVACIETTLVNGKTVQLTAISWLTAISSFIGLVATCVASFLGHSKASSYIMTTSLTLFSYYQSVAIIGLQASNKVPPIAAAWVQNFIWSLGIININVVQLISAWYVSIKPIRQKIKSSEVSVAIMKAKRSIDTIGENFFSKSNLIKRAESDKKNIIFRGIERVAFKADIPSENIFISSSIIIFILFMFATIILFMLKYIIIFGMKKKWIKSENYLRYKNNFSIFFKGAIYNLFILTSLQIYILSLWEFCRRDSVFCIILAVFLLLSSLFVSIWGFVQVYLSAQRSKAKFKTFAYILYSNEIILNKWGIIYVPFNAEKYYFYFVILFHGFVKSCFIGLGQSSGKVQGLAVFLLEATYLTLLIIWKPFLNNKMNTLNIVIQSICLLNSLFFLFFSNIFNQPKIIDGVMGVIFFFLNACTSLGLLLVFLLFYIWPYFSKKPDNKYSYLEDNRTSFINDVKTSKLKNESSITELDNLGNAMRGSNI